MAPDQSTPSPGTARWLYLGDDDDLVGRKDDKRLMCTCLAALQFSLPSRVCPTLDIKKMDKHKVEDLAQLPRPKKNAHGVIFLISSCL